MAAGHFFEVATSSGSSALGVALGASVSPRRRGHPLGRTACSRACRGGRREVSALRPRNGAPGPSGPALSRKEGVVEERAGGHAEALRDGDEGEDGEVVAAGLDATEQAHVDEELFGAGLLCPAARRAYLDEPAADVFEHAARRLHRLTLSWVDVG